MGVEFEPCHRFSLASVHTKGGSLTTTTKDQGAAASPVATPVEGKLLLEIVQDLGITHIITVPDTVQKTFLALLEQQDKIKLLTVCTEDEAMGINAGL